MRDRERVTPTDSDIARAAVARAREVFDASDGNLTAAYYRRLQGIGSLGVIAMNLFRASKTSNRAKMYRGHRYKRASYEVKNYSLHELCKALMCCAVCGGEIGYMPGACGAGDVLAHRSAAQFSHAATLHLPFGWKHDSLTARYDWVLYVDLPNGQVSFHCNFSPDWRLGPEYTGEWDQAARGTSILRIVEFCDSLLQEFTLPASSAGDITVETLERGYADG